MSTDFWLWIGPVAFLAAAIVAFNRAIVHGAAGRGPLAGRPRRRCHSADEFALASRARARRNRRWVRQDRWRRFREAHLAWMSRKG